MSDLHDKIRTEVERRLAIARLAEEWHLSPWRYKMATPRLDAIVAARGGTVFTFAHHYEPTTHAVNFVELHDPADAIRRYERDLKILGMHQWRAPGVNCGCDDAMCSCGEHVPWPCDELIWLAESLGLAVGVVAAPVPLNAP